MSVHFILETKSLPDIRKYYYSRAAKMAQCGVGVCYANLKDLSSIPRACKKREEKTGPRELFSDLHTCTVTCTCPQTQ